MDLNLHVLPHLQAFVSDVQTPFIAQVAGVGSGKTIGLIQHSILMAALNPGCLGILASPTFGMLEKNILNMRNGLPVHLSKAGIPFTFKGGDTFYLQWPNGQTSEIECTHAGSSMSGRTAAWFGVDEIDLMKTQEALTVWDILIARLRDPKAKHVQGFCASTPEGKRFLWQKFEQDLLEKPELNARFKLYRAETYDNFLLPPDFIPNLEAQYDPLRIRAHLKGEFVSLTTGLVYSDFDRKLNHCDEVMKAKEQLHCGMDFNNFGMSCVTAVIRDNKPIVVDEIMGSENTPALIKVMKDKYRDHQVICYPDATGKDVRSTTSSETDHNLLRQAGFAITTTPSNPHIMDRVGSVRAQILNGQGERRLKINTRNCPITTGCLEQHTMGDDGHPTKRVPFGKMKLHIDGPMDALGYFIDRRWPTRRPPAQLSLRGT